MSPRSVLVALCLLACHGASAEDRVAFVTPLGQLATVLPDGSAPRTLTPAGVVYQFPAWAPSGGSLAAVGSGADGGRVVIVDDRAGADGRVLFESEQETPIYLYWAPDAQRLGFLANHPEGLSLNVAAVGAGSGEGPTRVATGSPLYWQWQADSEELLLHSGAGQAERLAFVRASGGWLDGDALEVARPGPFNVPGVSASGRFLAYAEAIPGGGSRVVLESRPHTEGAVAGRVRREVPFEGLVALSWNPQTDHLAFMAPPVAAPHPYGPIRLLDAATGDLTTLVEGAALAFFWSPDGEKLAYLTPLAGEGGGQLADTGALGVLGGVQRHAIQRVQRSPLLLELSVLTLANGDRRALAAFAPTPLFLGQFLPFFDQYALSHRLWSPDSDALVLPMVGEGGRAQVVVVPLSGEPRVVAEGEMPFWSP